jgi:hypothetical protein
MPTVASIAAIAIGAFTGFAARLANAALRRSHHARATSAVSLPISASLSSEILMLVWAMAQCQKGADHDERDRRVECHGTLFLGEQQCKKHHSEAEEDGCKSWLAPEPASSYGLSITGAAFGRRI